MHRLKRKALDLNNKFRAFSSAGSEHLPYKQRVGGSNPSTPTKQKQQKIKRLEKSKRFFYSFLTKNNRQKTRKNTIKRDIFARKNYTKITLTQIWLNFLLA